MLRDPGLHVIAAAATAHGIQGAKVLTLASLRTTGRVVLRAKWRGYSTLTSLSDPRHELAAYAVQRLYLEPHEYIVPPTTGHCFELMEFRRHVDPAAKATFPGIACVFGVLSYWLENARTLDDAEDAELIDDDDRALDTRLFWRNVSYRESAANVNLLTYLIHHGDSHADQFLIGGDRTQPRLYSVDNSMSFSNFKNPDLDEDWSRLLVPAFPERSLDRLRRSSETDLLSLAVIEQYTARAGELVPRAPQTPVAASSKGLHWAGADLQVGLNTQEIGDLKRRLRALLERAARGRT